MLSLVGEIEAQVFRARVDRHLVTRLCKWKSRRMIMQASRADIILGNIQKQQNNVSDETHTWNIMITVEPQMHGRCMVIAIQYMG